MYSIYLRVDHYGCIGPLLVQLHAAINSRLLGQITFLLLNALVTYALLLNLCHLYIFVAVSYIFPLSILVMASKKDKRGMGAFCSYIG